MLVIIIHILGMYLHTQVRYKMLHYDVLYTYYKHRKNISTFQNIIAKGIVFFLVG